MSTSVIPTVAIQEIYSGNKFEGVVSDGDSTEETLYRGRIQKWIGGSQGGEFSAPDLVGMTVEHVWWSLDCATTPDVEIYLVDDDDVEYLIEAQSAESGEYNQPGGFLVPPSFKVRFKSDTNIDAVVSIVAEDTGVTGDGTTATYEATLVHGRVDPTTVSAVAGSVTFTDATGTGVLTGSGGGGGTGTIDYLTGEIEITLNTPSDFSGTNILVTYDYNRVGRVGLVLGQGWGQTMFSELNSLGTQNFPPTLQRS